MAAGRCKATPMGCMQDKKRLGHTRQVPLMWATVAALQSHAGHQQSVQTRVLWHAAYAALPGFKNEAVPQTVAVRTS